MCYLGRLDHCASHKEEMGQIHDLQFSKPGFVLCVICVKIVVFQHDNITGCISLIWYLTPAINVLFRKTGVLCKS